MALEITTIQSIEDIELNLVAIAAKVDPQYHHKLDNVRRELEYELGFSQHDHLRTNDSLEDFPGLTEKQIEDATQRGINNPIEMYPKEVKEHVKALTERGRHKQPRTSDPLSDTHSQATAQQRENRKQNEPTRQDNRQQRKRPQKVNQNRN